MSQTQGPGVSISPQAIQQIIALLQGAQQGNGQIQQGQQNQQNQQNGQLNPQGLFDDIGNFISNTATSLVNNPQVQQAAGSFFSSFLSALANDPASRPQVQQILARHSQTLNVAPADIWGDIGNFFTQTIPQVAVQAAPYIIQALPTILSALANQPMQPMQNQQHGQLQTQGAGPGNYRGYQGQNYQQNNQQGNQQRAGWN